MQYQVVMNQVCENIWDEIMPEESDIEFDYLGVKREGFPDNFIKGEGINKPITLTKPMQETVGFLKNFPLRSRLHAKSNHFISFQLIINC